MKILVCDDHALVRDGLRLLLASRGFSVVAEASDGDEALALARELLPDLVLMDVALGTGSGIEATRRLLAERPETRVLALSMLDDPRYVSAMLQAGAAGYVVKSALTEELVRALEVVAAGGCYVSPRACAGSARSSPAAGSPAVSSSAASSSAASSSAASSSAARVNAPTPLAAAGVGASSRAGALSKREREVLQLLASGEPSKSIAARLEIAVTTVETYRRQIMDKLGLRSVAELTKYAIRTGLTTLD